MKDDTDKTWMEVHGGFAKDMTLRDHYAGMAMQGFVANFEAGDDIGALPVLCWATADAMLKAREAK